MPSNAHTHNHTTSLTKSTRHKKDHKTIPLAQPALDLVYHPIFAKQHLCLVWRNFLKSLRYHAL